MGLEEVPAEVQRSMEFVSADDMGQVLEAVLERHVEDPAGVMSAAASRPAGQAAVE